MATDHADHGSRGSTGVIVAAVSTSIAFVALSLRLMTRAFIVRNVGPEDYVVLVAFALSVALTALICVEVQHGQGRHYSTVSPEELEQLNKVSLPERFPGSLLTYLKAFWASVPVYQASLTLTKISILLQYRRVFVGTGIQRFILGSIGVVIIYGLWSVLSTAFMCSPVSYFWDRSISGHCLSRLGVWFSNSALNIITDIVICVMPFPVLNKLHLPRKQKYALMAVFGLGLFVCLTSILRLKSLYDISVSDDITWDNTPAAYWSSLEVNFAVIAACLPTLRKTISRFFPRFFSSYSNSDSNHRYLPSRKTKTKSRADTNGFSKFAITSHAAQTDWVQGLTSQNVTAKGLSSEMDDLKKKPSLSTCNSDDGITVVGAEPEDGRIRVMTTIVTHELTPSPSELDVSVGPSSTASSPKERHLV
ncbi:hypothetical protein D6C92_01214 [Aureobasidium pullulans]|uniref:Rhodopsin domain-containing protein n=1 Tax=Aureobasidium pullulans TaxID=5580 RepID=A0A4S9RTF3_AURPU|nr:hypothetical protein D6D28_00327 [Aureobasidium pullulans]THZ01437.1 hypothetical protein D6C92_01214 [Aureobasidium pullulans]TIA23357.1 hypothetical protein D6C81_02967 [Aureobasidium pullulans]